MTAINLIRQRDAVHILSDGAACGPDGGVLFFTPKVFPLPHLRAAVAARGNLLALPLVTEFLATMASTYDDLAGTSVKALREATILRKINTARGKESPLDDSLQIFIAGFSNASKPDAFTVLSRESDGLPAYAAVPVHAFSFAPFDKPAQDELGTLFGGRTADEIDPRVDGLRILESQRRHKMKNQHAGGEPVFGVGGFAQLTTIRRDMITTEVLHRWPDEVGKKIAP